MVEIADFSGVRWFAGLAAAARKACAVAFVGLVSSCGDDAAPAKTSGGYEPKPEMIVRAKADAFACVTKDKYDEAIGHAVAKEKAKFEAMFEQMNCVQLTPSEDRFKILTVQPANVIEFTNVTSGQSDGMWASAEMFLPAK